MLHAREYARRGLGVQSLMQGSGPHSAVLARALPGRVLLGGRTPVQCSTWQQPWSVPTVAAAVLDRLHTNTDSTEQQPRLAFPLNAKLLLIEFRLIEHLHGVVNEAQAV